MVHDVSDVDGKTVPVLGLDDLNTAKDAVIGWLAGIFGATILAAVSLAVYATTVRAEVDAVGGRVQRLEADSLTRRNLDSLRIEMRHLSETTADLTRTVNELSRLLERRGVR